MISKKRTAREALPIARAAYYDPRQDRLVLLLDEYIELSLPRKGFPRLRNAPPEPLRTVELINRGTTVGWGDESTRFYEDFSVYELLEDLLHVPSVRSAGKRGGTSRSPAKAAASRRNGLKGGAPGKKRRAKAR